MFFKLVNLSKADNAAKSPKASQRLEALDTMEQIGMDISRRGDCVSLRQLAVNGDDLKNYCRDGREIGALLSDMLCAVMEERLPNDRDMLLRYAEEHTDGDI